MAEMLQPLADGIWHWLPDGLPESAESESAEPEEHVIHEIHEIEAATAASAHCSQDSS